MIDFLRAMAIGARRGTSRSLRERIVIPRILGIVNTGWPSGALAGWRGPEVAETPGIRGWAKLAGRRQGAARRGARGDVRGIGGGGERRAGGVTAGGTGRKCWRVALRFLSRC